MSTTRGRLCALVLLGAFALGNVGLVAQAAAAGRVASEPAQAMPCHGAPAGDTQPDDTAGCQWASPASCCDSPQAIDTRGPQTPAPLVAWRQVGEEPRALRAPASAPALEPPLPVPRSARVLLI